jgi:hypothetical protein
MMKHRHALFAGRVASLVLLGLPLLGVAEPERRASEVDLSRRPSIWVTPADRGNLLAKIAGQEWARRQFEALKERAEEGVENHRRDPAGHLRRIPWVESQSSDHPSLPRIDSNMAATGRAGMQSAMQSLLGHGIDCGVLHFLTGERRYAAVAADVLQAFVRALRTTPVSTQTGNGGWVYANDHLYEARALGAQIPILYDFVAAYLSEPGVTVLDLPSGRRVPFAQADAQAVFRTYARLAVEHGMSDTNWPVLEMPSLAHNALALEDPQERAHWLAYVTHVDAERQDPLKKLFHEFEQFDGVWPESVQYSAGVAANITYIVALLRRQQPAIEMPRGFERIPRSILRLREFRFPNGEFVRFGDGPRRSGPPYQSLEIAYSLAAREADEGGQREFGGLLREALTAGQLRRDRLWAPLAGANVYLGPLSLLWFAPEIAAPAVKAAAPRVTDELPFAGLVVQRNLAPDGDPAGGLMAAVSGAAYVHSHASGMALELYGAGTVLGPNAGKGTYTTEEHENHRRLFAGANTVIVKGAARSSGGWVNLGIPRVRPVAAEPAFGSDPVSPRHSFVVTGFQQDHGADRPAPQERLVGIVRTSPRHGFYVDVFRSRTAAGEPEQFHDFLYRNLGEELRLHGGGAPLRLTPDPERFRPVAGSTWEQNRTYLFPGWHYFKEVRSSGPFADDVLARFAVARLRPKPAAMYLHMAGEPDRSYAVGMAPAITEAPAGYENLPVPVLAVRQQGEAWNRPFAVVYEPRIEGQTTEVHSVTALRQSGRFSGFVVQTRDPSGERRHLVILPPGPDATARDESHGFEFTGRYAVITTDALGRCLELYVGEGQRLAYRGHTLEASDGRAFSAWIDLEAGREPVIGRGSPVFRRAP